MEPQAAQVRVLTLERVPPPAVDAVVETLIAEVGLIVAHARTLVACAPLPCARGETAWIEALAERLSTAGAVVEARSVADRGCCNAHARLPSATTCRGCARRMCLLCARLGHGATCRECVERTARRQFATTIVVLALATAGLAAGTWWARRARRAPQSAVAPAARRKSTLAATPANEDSAFRSPGTAAAEAAATESPAPPAGLPAVVSVEPPADLAPLLEARRFQDALDLLDRTEGDDARRDEWSRGVLAAADAAARAGEAAWVVRFADLGLRRHGPERDPLLLLRAATARDAGRLDDAIADLRQVSPLSEVYGAALVALGECLHRSGDMERARAAWESAVRLGGAAATVAAAALARSGGSDRVAAGYESFASPHFKLRVPPQIQSLQASALADGVLRLLEENFSRITASLGGVDDARIPAILFSREDFSRRFAAHARGALGFYIFAERTFAVNGMVATATDPWGRDTFAHELTHAVVDRLLAGRRVPQWLDEGLGRYHGRLGAGWVPVTDAEWYGLKVLAKRGQLPRLADITHGTGVANTLTYCMGSALVSFIDERFSLLRLRDYFSRIRAGEPHADAFRGSFGLDDAAFEEEFSRFVLAHSTGSVSAMPGE